MTVVLLAGTGSGIHLVEDGRIIDVGGPVSALATDVAAWAVVGDHRIISSVDGQHWDTVASVSDASIRCVLPAPSDTFVGTSEAHLYRLRDGGADRIEAFEEVESRDTWHTPWGGPPDTRSLSVANDGAVYANVHVGGIPRTTDGGRTWKPTIDVDADVHQVLAHDDVVLAACAPGLAISYDGGRTWRIDADGMHARYSRAVAVAGDTLLVSASTGPFTEQAALYRRPLRSDGPFERCAGGLPEWFGANIDTHRLVTDGAVVAIGTDSGETWLSEDQGTTWQQAANGMPPISCLAFLNSGT